MFFAIYRFEKNFSSEKNLVEYISSFVLKLVLYRKTQAQSKLEPYWILSRLDFAWRTTRTLTLFQSCCPLVITASCPWSVCRSDAYHQFHLVALSSWLIQTFLVVFMLQWCNFSKPKISASINFGYVEYSIATNFLAPALVSVLH